MDLKSYSKINLFLDVNKKLSNGLHDIQSLFCLVDLFDTISIKKKNNENRNKNRNRDKNKNENEK